MLMMHPEIPIVMMISAMSFVIQLTRNRRSCGTISAKCAKLNGKTIRSHAELTVQNRDTSISGGRAVFLLPVASLANGPDTPKSIEPYNKIFSTTPNEEVKNPVACVSCA